MVSRRIVIQGGLLTGLHRISLPGELLLEHAGPRRTLARIVQERCAIKDAVLRIEDVCHFMKYNAAFGGMVGRILLDGRPRQDNHPAHPCLAERRILLDDGRIVSRPSAPGHEGVRVDEDSHKLCEARVRKAID